jgi:hypothetical protein
MVPARGRQTSAGSELNAESVPCYPGDPHVYDAGFRETIPISGSGTFTCFSGIFAGGPLNV